MAGAEGLEFALQKHSRTARLERFALLLVFSPQRLAFFCHRQRQDASPRHTPRASESTKPPALNKRNNLRLAEVISLNYNAIFDTKVSWCIFCTTAVILVHIGVNGA